MRDSLVRWIRDADAVRHLEHFRVAEAPLELAHVRSRTDDYYLALAAFPRRGAAARPAVADSARLGSPGYASRFQSNALEARLPEGVSVEPDRLEVRFTGAKEAVVRLFAMAQALTRRRRPQQSPSPRLPAGCPLTSSEPAAPCYAGGR